MTIGSCRAHFRLKGIEAGDPDPTNPESAVRALVLNFDGEGKQTTGIGHTEITELTEKAGAWYTLDGRRLSGKPTQKGVYIQNGKKQLIIE